MTTKGLTPPIRVTTGPLDRTGTPGWRETITLMRMVLAFLFPSPFLTRGLQGKIDRREQRLAAQQSASAARNAQRG